MGTCRIGRKRRQRAFLLKLREQLRGGLPARAVVKISKASIQIRIQDAETNNSFFRCVRVRTSRRSKGERKSYIRSW